MSFNDPNDSIAIRYLRHEGFNDTVFSIRNRVGRVPLSDERYAGILTSLLESASRDDGAPSSPAATQALLTTLAQKKRVSGFCAISSWS